MKHKFKTKTLCVILSLIMLMQIIPLSVFAEENSANTSSNVFLQNAIPEAEIVSEIIEKRDEYTKVYELSDGSFCEMNYFLPVHKLVDGEWVEIYDLSEEHLTTIDETVETISERQATTYEAFSLSNEFAQAGESSNEGIMLTSSASSLITGNAKSTIAKFVMTENGYALSQDKTYPIKSDESVVIIKPQTLKSTPGTNCIVVDAFMNINCKVSSTTNITDNYIVATEALESWDSSTTLYDIDGNMSSTILDNVNVTKNGLHSWDITEAYNRWESGKSDNNGIILSACDEEGATIVTGVFIFQYFETTPMDDKFSYYTIDMGRAGTVYINDYTNEPSLTRSDMSLFGEILPVSIESMYSFNNEPSTTNNGYNWTLNYNSYLEKIDDTYIWKNLDYKKVKFTVVENEFDEEGRSKWIDETGNYTLWVDDMNSDYMLDFSYNSLFYNDSIEYKFYEGLGEKALLKSVKDISKNKTVNIFYDDATSSIDYIQDVIGRKFKFIYNDSGLLTEIKALNAEGNQIIISQNSAEAENSESDDNNVYIHILFGYSVIGDKTVLSSITYADDETVSYGYDSDGHLNYIKNIDDTEFMVSDLIDVNQNIVGKEYIKRKTISLNNIETIERLTIDDSNAYQREIAHNDGTCERVLYNKSLNKQYYKNFTRNNGSEETVAEYCLKYDENNNISEVFIPTTEEDDAFLENESFESYTIATNSPKKWNIQGDVDSVSTESGISKPFSCGNRDLRIHGSYNEESFATQTIAISSESDLADGDILAIEGLGKSFNAIHSSKYFFGIKVYAVYDVPDAEPLLVEMVSLPFDSTIENVWQYRMSTFEVITTYGDYELVGYRVDCAFNNQLGEARFDGLKMYKTDEIYTTPTNNFCVCGADCAYGEGCPCECISVDSCLCEECKPSYCPCGEANCNYGEGCPCECELSAGPCNCIFCKTDSGEETVGHTIKNYVTDGTKRMETSVEYTENDNYITKVTDENGNAIIYNYNQDTGMIHTIEDSGGEVVYSYDAMGYLKEVSQTVTSIYQENSLTLKNSYIYENDRISKVEHNGTVYNFFYNAYGDYAAIKMNNTSLETYTYNSDDQSLNTITYGNGGVVKYSYANGRISSIYVEDLINPAFEYSYDDEGKMIKATDHLSGMTTEYNCTKNIKNDDGEYESTFFDICIYRTTPPDGMEIDLRYTRQMLSDGSIKEIFAGEELITTPNAKEYDCQTGITIESDTTEFIRGELISAMAFDSFGRIVDVPENTTFESGENQYAIESSGIIIQTNTQGEIVGKRETSYYYNDTNEKATNEITGFVSKVSRMPDVYDPDSNTIAVNTFIWENQYSYEYDEYGNISHIYSGLDEQTRTSKVRYEYDDAGQIIREDNAELEKTWVYTYNAGGNISTKTEYEYTTSDSLGSSVNTVSFDYDNTWTDKLVKYGSQNITYDSIGNVLSVGEANENNETYYVFEWQGKQLASCKVYNVAGNPNSNYMYTYEYDDNGYCTVKNSYYMTINSDGSEELNSPTRTEYVWSEGKLIYQYVGPKKDSASLTIKYLYDKNGEPYGLITNGTRVFYYLKNAQGDVEEIIQASSGVSFVEYYYDAWGNMTYHASSGTPDVMVAAYSLLGNNMITYRGYYYDYNLKMYYLQSRYYCPQWGRFLNADNVRVLEPTVGELHGANLFAYCNNDPINRIDPYGSASYTYRTSNKNNKYTIDVTIKTNFGNKYPAKYTLSDKAIAQVDCTSNVTKKIVNKSLTDTFSSAILNISRSLRSDSLSGRTIKGIQFEILAHYYAYKFNIKRSSSKIADIGGTNKNKIGYDSNAWAFESGKNLAYGALLAVAPAPVALVIISTFIEDYL